MASIPVKICSCFPLVNNLSNSRMMDLNLFQKWPYNPFQTDGQEQVFLIIDHMFCSWHCVTLPDLKNAKASASIDYQHLAPTFLFNSYQYCCYIVI